MQKVAKDNQAPFWTMASIMGSRYSTSSAAPSSVTALVNTKSIFCSYGEKGFSLSVHHRINSGWLLQE